jgi:hypothetical protein
MSRFPSLIRSRCAVGGWFAAILLGSLVVQLVCARTAAITNEINNRSENPDPLNGGAQIECITPDGRISPVANPGTSTPGAPALMMDDATISCALQEGETTFIIPLFRAALLDRFTLINQNAAAHGEFNIAVSNSPKWTQVDGIVSFAHKRLFNLSMLGVEAKYMKLSFHVEKAGQMTGLSLYRVEKEPTDAIAKTAKPPAPAESRYGEDRNFDCISLLAASLL